MTYIALLRGINVGGNNIIKMVDLRECLEKAGYKNVVTYIQSGNVIFETRKTKIATLESDIETTLKKRFGYTGFAVVLPFPQLGDIINQAPKGFGVKPEEYRYDVIFLKQPLEARVAAADIPTNKEVDTVIAGKHAIYTTRLIAQASKSKLSKMTSIAAYKRFTIRNWNTTTKLYELASNK